MTTDIDVGNERQAETAIPIARIRPKCLKFTSESLTQMSARRWGEQAIHEMPDDTKETWSGKEENQARSG